MAPELYDTVIIGGGAAGLAAALYAGRFEMKTLVIAENIGGAIVNTNEIANYPGFQMISGIELIDKLQKHAEEYHPKFEAAKVQKIEKHRDCFKVMTPDKAYYAKTIIIATGTEWKKLNVPGEKEFMGRGVHYCALCDGAFYKDKIVAIVGGSDSAIKDALLLTEYAKKVYIIYRKTDVRAEPINKKRMKDNKKIALITETNVKEIKGNKFVNKLILDKPYSGSMELCVDGIFIDVGRDIVSDIAKNLGVEINSKKEIVLTRHGFTSVPGVFAAGDVTDSEFKQVIRAVSEGVTAAYNAYHYIYAKSYVCED